MSTKMSLVYSTHPKQDFHFYQECFDQDGVYLALYGECAQWETNVHKDGQRVTVRIPRDIWELIRQTELATGAEERD